MSFFFDDHRCAVQTVDFDYDAIDRREQEQPARSEDQAVLLREVLRWVVQEVPRNTDGIELRATIAAWIFLPPLGHKNLTEISSMIGRHKQSLGRWVEDFKKTFPGVIASGRSGRKKSRATSGSAALG